MQPPDHGLPHLLEVESGRQVEGLAQPGQRVRSLLPRIADRRRRGRDLDQRASGVQPSPGPVVEAPAGAQEGAEVGELVAGELPGALEVWAVLLGGQLRHQRAAVEGRQHVEADVGRLGERVARNGPVSTSTAASTAAVATWASDSFLAACTRQPMKARLSTSSATRARARACSISSSQIGAQSGQPSSGGSVSPQALRRTRSTRSAFSTSSSRRGAAASARSARR